jgi:hypothetical protein
MNDKQILEFLKWVTIKYEKNLKLLTVILDEIKYYKHLKAENKKFNNANPHNLLNL